MANFFNVNIEKAIYNGLIVNMMVLNGNVIYTSRPIYEPPYEFRGTDITETDTLVTKKHTDLSCMFYNCTKLVFVNTEDWYTSNVIDMNRMFYNCTSLPSINTINISVASVENMSYMFYNCSSLTELDLSTWYTAYVVYMNNMFAGCTSLASLDMRRWDVSSAINMSNMFSNCSSLTTLDLSSWHTDRVNNMSNMFQNCKNLSRLDLSNFSIGSSTNISNMLYGCTSLCDLILSDCDYDTIVRIINSSGFPTDDIGKPRTIYCRYSEVGELEVPAPWNIYYVDGIDDSVIPDATRYEEGQYQFNDNIIAVNTIVDKEHKSLDYMFDGCDNLLIVNNMANWDTSNVDIMRNMFSSCSRLLTLNVSNFKTDNVTNMDGMFWACYKIKKLDVSKWDTSQVYNMLGLFGNCQSLKSLDVSNWDTSNVGNMYGMFTGCQSITSLDLSNFDTSMVTDMNSMFENCFLLESLDISNFDMTNVIDTSYMFRNCYALCELRLDNCRADTISKIINSSDFPTGKIDKVRKIYCRKSEILAAGLSEPTDWVFSYVEETSALPEIPVIPEGVYKKGEYRSNPNITSVTTIVNTSHTDLSYMFDSCYGLASINMQDWDTSNVTDMRNMFYYCQDLLGLDVSNFDTSKVTNMRNMFCKSRNIRLTGISNWRTSNVTDMYSMFAGCLQIIPNNYDDYLDLSGWDTSNVINMAHMFDGCVSLRYLNLSNFDVSNADVDYMLNNCDALRELRLDDCDSDTISKIINSLGFPTGKLDSGIRIIYCDEDFAGDLEEPDGWIFSFNVGKPIDPEIPEDQITVYKPKEFQNKSNITYAVTKVNETHTDLSYMFSNCYNLTYINTQDWDTRNVTNMRSMFSGCELLPELNINNWDTSNVTNMEGMFSKCYKLTELDLSNWSLSSIEYNRPTHSGGLMYMFNDCSSLRSLNLSNWDLSNIDDGGTAATSQMFSGCRLLSELHLDNCNYDTINRIINWSDLPNYEVWDEEKGEIITTRTIYCKRANTAGLEDLLPNTWVFSFVSDEAEIPLYEVGQFKNNTEITEVRTMVNESHDDLNMMFFGCSNLVSVNTEDWDTSNVTDMSAMFHSCASLTELDLSNFNTSKVTNMCEVFNSCSSLQSLDLSNWDTSKVTDMRWMFQYCMSLVNLDLSSFDMSNITNTTNMFHYCQALTNLQAPRNISANISFSSCTNLTHESLMSIINNLATISGKTLTLGATNLAKLSEEEKAIATNKGWTLQ